MDRMVACEVLYVVDPEIKSQNGKSYSPKYLIFQPDVDLHEDNFVVRAYGRSTTVKTWVGDYSWDNLGFGLIVDYPNQWMKLDTPLFVWYEKKVNDKGDLMYYIATDIRIDDPHEYDEWGRISLDNEIVVLDSIKRDGLKCWQGEGKLDGETMRVTLYNEHRRALDKAGYKVAWDNPDMRISGYRPTVALVEHNGRRRVAAVLKVGTDDDWIEIKQKR